MGSGLGLGLGLASGLRGCSLPVGELAEDVLDDDDRLLHDVVDLGLDELEQHLVRVRGQGQGWGWGLGVRG